MPSFKRERRWVNWDRHWEKRRREAEETFVKRLMEMDESTKIRLDAAKAEQMAITEKHKQQCAKGIINRQSRKKEVHVIEQSRKTMRYQKKKADGGFNK